MNVLRLKQALLSPPTPTKWRRAMEGLDVTFGATGFEIRSAAPPEGDEYLNVTFGVTGFQLAHAIPPVAKEGISVAFGANEFIYKHHPYTSSREGVTVAFGATELVFQHHPYTNSSETVNVTFGVNEFVYTGDPSFTTWSPLLMATAPYLVYDERSTVTPASGAISQWNDRSGSNRHMTQATGSYQPVAVDAVVGNKRITRFTNDRLSTTSGVDILNNQPSGWMFVAVKRTSTDASPTGRTIARINTNAANSTRMAFFSDDGANVNKLVFGNRRLDGEAYVGLPSTGTIGTSEWTLALGVTDYANRTIKLYLNSELNGTLTNQFTAGGNTSATNSSSIEIGNGSTNVEPFNGDIACVLAGRGIPTMQDIERLFGYYAQRYNLAAQLPANHSYKSRIPYPVSKTIDLRFDQTAGTTTFTDNAARLWTTSGTAAVSDTQKRIGSGSYYTAPGSVGYAKSSYTSYLNLSRDMFCIEAWVYPVGTDAKSANGCILSKRLSETDNDWVLQRDQANNRIVFRFGDTSDSNRTLVSTNGSVPTNTWTHIAVTRYRTTLTLYVNGNSVGTATIVGELLNRTTPVFLGGSGTTSDGSTLLSDGYWGGYLDNVQLTYGDFVYSSNFNPMDAVTSDTMNDGAPWSKVQLLLHFDGSDGIPTYTDSSLYSRTLTSAGSGTISTAQSVFGSASIYNPANQIIATTAVTESIHMRNGAFQVDVRLYPTATNGNDFQTFIGCGSNTYGLVYEWSWALRNDGVNFYYGIRGTNQSHTRFIYPNGKKLTDYMNKWVSVSVARDANGNFGVWINGARCIQYQTSPLQGGISYGSVVTGTYSNTTDFGNAHTGNAFNVGWFENAANFIGYMDELRYIVGWSRDVTVSYTPLTVPFGFEIPTDPYQSNITAQFSGLNFAGTQNFLDDAGMSWTRTGTPVISTAVTKWAGRRVLSFPNTTSTDHYSTTTKPVTQGQPFTMEAWVYVTGDGYSANGGTPYLQAVFSEPSNTSYGEQFFGIDNSRRIRFYRASGVGNNEDIVGTTVVSKNTWHYLTCTYDGTTIRLFLNGVLEASDASAVGWKNTPEPFMIGRSLVPSYPGWAFGLQGYIGEYRITNGICRYTSNFSVPQQPFDSLVGEVKSDPYWESVVSLLHMDTITGTVLYSDTGNWSTSNAGNIIAGAARFGDLGYSNTSNSQSNYITYTGNATDFNPLDSDFTMEAWVYMTQNPTGFGGWIISQDNTTHPRGLNMTVNTNGTMLMNCWTSNGVYDNVDSGATLVPLNTWCHVAATRSGTTMYLFLNGAQVGTGTKTGPQQNLSSVGITIGRIATGPQTTVFPGYIDEVRITKGVARYTANFTVPSGPFPDATTQSLYYFNPPDRHANITIENSHRTATVLTGGAWTMARGSLSKSTGKWYAEFKILNNAGNDMMVGIENGTGSRAGYPGSQPTGYGYYCRSNFYNNSNSSDSHQTYTAGDTIGVAYDAVSAKVWFSKNGVWSGDPTAGTGQAFSSVVSRQRLAFGSSIAGASVTLRTRANEFTYTPPTGFMAWGGGTLVSNPVTTYRNLVVNKGPICYYPMDTVADGNVITDISGNNYHGSMVGANYTVGTALMAGNSAALGFNVGSTGTTQVQVPLAQAGDRLSHLAVSGRSFTILMWYRKTANTTYNMVLAGYVDPYWGTCAYRIVDTEAQSPDNTNGMTIGSSTIDELNCIAWVKDAVNSQYRTFSNGQWRTSGSFTDHSTVATNPVMFPSFASWDYYGLRGYMSDVAFFDKVLTNTEIEELYHLGLYGVLPDPPLTEEYVDKTYAEYVADLDTGTYTNITSNATIATAGYVLGLNRMNIDNVNKQYSGSMWGSPRAGTRAVTTDSNTSRILQHAFEHFHVLTSNTANVVVVDVDSTANVTSLSSVNYNDYSSNSYSGNYAGWQFKSFVYWDPMLNRARRFDCITQTYDDYYPGNPWHVTYCPQWTINNTGWDNYVCRVVLDPSASRIGSRIRLTLSSGGLDGNPLVITAAYIGIATGDRTYAFTTTPTQLTFNGYVNATIPTYGTVLTDEVALTLTGSERIMLSIQLASGDTMQTNGLSSGFTFRYKTPALAGDVNSISSPVTGYEGVGSTCFIAAVEIL